MNQPRRLFVVDDSALLRGAIRAIFERDPGIEIVGEAATGHDALIGIKALKPDVVTLDVNIPEMDGIRVLKHIMIECATPTVMLSTLTRDGERLTFDALRYGAVDFLPKPNRLDDSSLLGREAEIRQKVHWAANIELDVLRYIRLRPTSRPGQTYRTPTHLVAMGGHEGAYSSLLKILPRLNPNLPAAYIIVLYESSAHVDAFIRYLDDFSPMPVRRARDGEELSAGSCYLASGDDYVTLQQRAGRLALHVHPAPFATLKGSINRILFSIADTLMQNSIGVLLSGSGDDGSEGLEEVLRMGGMAIIQDPKSCLSKQMPRHAMDNTRAHIIQADSKIASTINHHFNQSISTQRTA